MNLREMGPLDRLLSGIDAGLRTIAAPAARHTRPNPALDIPDSALSKVEKAHAAGLMRVNHAGEVAAQGLYQGHASVARNESTERQMREAAEEELDHLGWCEQRLDELGEGPSKLRPVWYTGAFAIGAISGILGDRWSLGFIEETERQVAEHLNGHLKKLPDTDARSRAIVKQMCEEEEIHGANAKKAGAASLPLPIRRLMRLTAKVMTSAAYRI
jgi:ubiquinone biosynthesis monooxygenase Coq7